jgi:hypothetical protein
LSVTTLSEEKPNFTKDVLGVLPHTQIFAKHSSLFCLFVSNEDKLFIGLTPGCGLDVKHFRLLLDDHLDEVLEQVLQNVFLCLQCYDQGILRGEYHCTIDLLFDWFRFSCMTTDNFCFYLQNRLIQTSKTGGHQYSDTSPFL